MVRRVVKIAAIVLVIGLIVPQAVEAASALFTSGSAAVPAVKGVNSAGSGAKGVEGFASAGSGSTYGVFGTSKSANGVGVYGQNVNGSGPAVGVYGKTPSANGRAVEGYANSTSTSQHFGGAFTTIADGNNNGGLFSSAGVLGHAKGGVGPTSGVIGISDSEDGAGVFGYAPGTVAFGVVGGATTTGVAGFASIFGLLGDSQAIGDGTYGAWSATDIGVSGHLVGGGTNLGGVCTIPTSATDSGTTCTFQTPFDSAIGDPIVVLTPTENPGDFFWVTNFAPDTDGLITGFTITLGTAATGDGISFNWHVVGIDASISATSPARAARRAALHDKF